MNLNKVILIGRIGSDIRYFHTAQGVSYIRATIVVNRRMGNNKEIADYIPIIAWRATADFINSYMQKGDLVSVEGNIQSSQYTDKNQQIVRSVDVVVDTITSLESREVRETRRQKSNQPSTPYSYGNSSSYANSNFKGSKTYDASKPKFEAKPSFSNQFAPTTNFSQDSNNEDHQDWESIEEVDSTPIKGFRLPDEDDDME